MNEFIIQDKFPKLQQIPAVISASFLAVWCIYLSFMAIMMSAYDYSFYLAIAGLAVALFTILAMTVWLPKPIFKLSADGIFPNLKNQKSLKPVLWKNMADVNIGLSFLKITLKTNKIVNIDLSSLRYADLKELKSKVMEQCESKQIPYRNA